MKTEIVRILLLFVILAVISAPVLAKKDSRKPNGATIFAQNCASCHTGGGNIIKPKHTIVGSKQLTNILSFKTYLSKPPGHMPYYQNIVNDKEQLSSLYKYCKETFKDRVQKQSSITRPEESVAFEISNAHKNNNDQGKQ